MRLIFLGTRGNTELRTRRHRWHSALLIVHRRTRVMIDCGADWRGRIRPLRPHAILVTHAHPDHAWGLADGAPCPVHATAESFAAMKDYPLSRRTVDPRVPFRIGTVACEAFPVDHSILAPAVGYRVSAGGVAFFYVPDVVAIRDREEALKGARLFVGDGATLTRPLVRRRGGALFGHTPVRTQLGWCRDEGVPAAIFTHCGTEIVTGDERRLRAQLGEMARARGVSARIAYDGLRVDLRG